jgi:hypothetical protein
MHIITLLARHGTAAYGEAIDAVDALFARQLPEVAHDLIVIDTALAEDHHDSLGAGRALIGASNADWEFSAWDRGVSWLGARLDRYDFVHLATSAFRALHAGYLDRFEDHMLQSVRGRAVAVGHIDFYNEPVAIGDRALRSWLRSSCVFMPPTELRLLGSLVGLENPQALFSGDPSAPFRADAPLSQRYRQYIVDWLTGPGTGQGTAWHSRFDLTPATLGRFEAKARAILNEQLLSARLRAQGCATVDAIWLAARCARLSDGEPLGAVPPWRRQLAGRDIDAPPRRLLYPDE